MTTLPRPKQVFFSIGQFGLRGGHKMKGKRQEVRTKIYLLLDCLSEKYSNNQAIRQSIIFFSS